MSHTIAAEMHPTITVRRTPGIWAGRILSAVPVAFLLFDAAVKLVRAPIAVETTAQIGYPAGILIPLGAIELACLAVYLTPRIAPLGAILWTAYLGGAVATHVRLGNPLFSHVLFPTYVAAMLWVGLWLRDARVRALLGLRSDPARGGCL